MNLNFILLAQVGQLIMLHYRETKPKWAEPNKVALLYWEIALLEWRLKILTTGHVSAQTLTAQVGINNQPMQLMGHASAQTLIGKWAV